MTRENRQWIEIARRTNEETKNEGKRCRIIAVQKNGTSSSSNKNGYLSPRTGAEVANRVAVAPLSKNDEASVFIMDTETFRQVCYSRNHVP